MFFLSVLSVCLRVSMLTGLPFCLGACISVCLHFCLCPRSCGIVTKCWLHTWQAPLPACLAFWGFQALRIPLPGFLSFSLLSLLSSSVFSSFPPFPWVEPVVLYHFIPVRSVNRNCWLLAYAGITERRVARFSRLCLVTTPAPLSPPPLSLVNRVLYHQLYWAGSHCVACDKKPILLWFKWINIPAACLFCAWLSGHIDRLKLVIYSARFICKAGMHLWLVFCFFRACVWWMPQCHIDYVPSPGVHWTH